MISCYFGLTESGKSYHVENHVLPMWERKIVFDNARCFKGGTIVENPSKKTFQKLFQDLCRSSQYFLIIRPGRTSDRKVLFNQAVELACALGRVMGKGIDPKKRIQLICDEADLVCSSHSQSKQVHYLVNIARHDNVDSHFIARRPMRINPDIRGNCTHIVTFRLKNARKTDFFAEMFGEEYVGKIGFLKKYCRMEADETGKLAFVNEKNKKVAKIDEILQKTQFFDEKEEDYGSDQD